MNNLELNTKLMLVYMRILKNEYDKWISIYRG